MNTSNVDIDQFSRDVQRLYIKLGQVLTDLSLQPIYGTARSIGPRTKDLSDWDTIREEWGLDDEPQDVSRMLENLSSVLQEVRQRVELLPQYAVDGATPWPADYADDFRDLLSHYLVGHLISRWRSSPPASLHLAVIEFAGMCVANLQRESGSEQLPAIASELLQLLGLVTSGDRFSRKLAFEREYASAKVPATPVGVGEQYADGPDEAAAAESADPDGPVDGYKWRHAGQLIEVILQPKAWLLCDYLLRQPSRVASFDDLKVPVYQDKDCLLPEYPFGSLRRAANNYFRKYGIPLKVEVDVKRRRVVRLLDHHWTDE